MKLLFITATNTDIGKSYASLKLIEKFSKYGVKVGVCKPIETGVIDDIPIDATKLLNSVKRYNSNFKELIAKDITAYTFSLPSAPFCADINQEIRVDRIKDKIYELSNLCDILIIEGAGGLKVPIKRDYMMIDLAKELNAKVLLITPSKLGCINDTLLSIEALESRGIDFDWSVNLYEDIDEFNMVTKPFYDSFFKKWWTLEEGLDDFVKSFYHQL